MLSIALCDVDISFLPSVKAIQFKSYWLECKSYFPTGLKADFSMVDELKWVIYCAHPAMPPLWPAEEMVSSLLLQWHNSCKQLLIDNV